ncbi:MAG: ABC transporter permease [Mucilaginibacter sp.]|nr:ABC transporter permease [Mucilaginibacter sp.]
MVSHQLKSAYRHLSRSKTFSAINISGLFISLTAVILMSLYIENELSYDTFNKNAAHIYRIVDDKKTNALMQRGAGSPGPLAPILKNDFPQVIQVTRFINGEALVKYQDKMFEERHLYFADPEVFRVFDLPMTSGNPAAALKEPMSVVITETTARKYFNRSEALGKVLVLNNENFKVTGVIKDVPDNSHLRFDILVSMATAERKDSGYDWLFTNWYSNNFYTYALLADERAAAELNQQFDAFAERHKANSAGTKHHYSLEKLTDIYLHSDRENQAGPTGNVSSLYIFSAIAFFVLLIACINFINLSTARAVERAKEVAVKKVNGVSRSSLIIQFFTESFLMAGTALTLAVLAAGLSMPAFNRFAGKHIQLDILTPLHAGALALILFTVGILSGIYPAFILSGFKPVTALKGTLRSSLRNTMIRKSLVVFQFSISVILIICTIVVFRQLQFMQQHDLGFKPSQTLVINFEGDATVQKQNDYIVRELERVNGVRSVTASSEVPGASTSGGWSMEFAKKGGDTIRAELPIYLTDFNFLRQYRIPMVSGRSFSPAFAADTVESMIINESALRKLGFRDAAEAIGVRVKMYPNDAKVIGVYRDFHFRSLQLPVEPLAMRIMPDKFRVFSVEMETSDVKKTVGDIETLWKKMAPQRPLEYSFLNERFNLQYASEIKFGQLFGLFTTLAISIACFGLFGLALFSVKQRRKEIGIRKVIGASVFRITALITKDFISLVLLSIVIACPIALFAMTQWVRTFAFRIHLSWWIFAASGLTAVFVALVTIGYQALKAAIANPVNSLRND